MPARSSIGSRPIGYEAITPQVGSNLIFSGTAGTPGSVAVTPNTAYRLTNTGTAAVFVGSGTAMVTGAATAAYGAVPPSSWLDIVIPAGQAALWYIGAGTLTIVRHAE